MLSKKSLQLNISITPEQAAFLEQAGQTHCIPGPAMVRGLIDAASSFYTKNGWFSFPVTVTPLMFQDKDPKTAASEPKGASEQSTRSKIRIPSGIRRKPGA
jgi:hypothetical protein